MQYHFGHVFLPHVNKNYENLVTLLIFQFKIIASDLLTIPLTLGSYKCPMFSSIAVLF